MDSEERGNACSKTFFLSLCLYNSGFVCEALDLALTQSSRLFGWGLFLYSKQVLEVVNFTAYGKMIRCTYWFLKGLD